MTDDTPTHRLTVTMTARYIDGKEQESATVTVAGDGSLDHVIDTFQAALLAMGFAPETAGELGVRGG